QWVAVLAMAMVLSGTARLMAGATVTTLTGGPYQGNPQFYGFTDGDTAAVAQFHTPIRLALDSSQTFLFVADRDNNAIRRLDLAGGVTFTFTTSKLNKPVGVAVDAGGNVYVLNRGNGSNGSVLQFDPFGDFARTNVSGLVNANGLVLDSL